MKRTLIQVTHNITTLFLILQLSFGLPSAVFADQGDGQGVNQGEGQGANQGEGQGAQEEPASTDVTASNTNTGADSENSNQTTSDTTNSTTVTNTADDATAIAGTAATGDNTNSRNSGDAGITTGDASIGVTQVKSDNTTTIGGDVLFANTAHDGTIHGDLVINPSSASSLASSDGTIKSVTATNSATGSGSDNAITIDTKVTEINEVQNDGTIDNAIAAIASTGSNHADKNTGDASVTTGNANVAASLVNLLNTTVENGNILVVTEDVYGDVTGNILIPDFDQLSTILTGNNNTTVDASNANTGANSTNTIDITKTKNDSTIVDSNATVDTTIAATAITGQNDSLENTGVSSITTGEANVQAGNVTLANTTVQDASLGIVIVNALNRFIGFLIGSDNIATPLSEEETLSYVHANNEQTGANSNNSINITDEQTTKTTVTNNATITNSVDAAALTGNNTTNKNTGTGAITTGDANITATAVNVANTTVKNGNLAVYIINVFGNFFGDVLFGGTRLALPYDTSSPNSSATIHADNTNTGADSTNEIAVTVTNNKDVKLNNSATVRTTLATTTNTGNNRANKNTSGANITTGESNVNLFSRTIANTVALGGGGSIYNATLNSSNDTTGANSKNHTTLDVTDNLLVDIHNFANVQTFIPGSANTGNNELNQNTIGGTIKTGLIDLGVNIGNILNQIYLALGGGNTNVAATGENHLTGSNSDNTNALTYTRNWLLSIFNEATVNNIIEFILNTGGNTANENTLAAAITTGSVCGDINVQNDANNISGTPNNASATIINNASASTSGNVLATTGNNILSNNTAGGTIEENQGCPPEPTPPPAPVVSPIASVEEGGQGGNGGGGQGGGEIASIQDTKSEPAQPRVAAKISRILKGVGALGFGWMQTPVSASNKFPVGPLVMASIIAIATAAWADRRAHLNNKRHALL